VGCHPAPPPPLQKWGVSFHREGKTGVWGVVLVCVVGVWGGGGGGGGRGEVGCVGDPPPEIEFGT